MRTVLHVGCGRKRRHQTTPVFAAPGWQEITLDIDPEVLPDGVGTMTDMSSVADSSIDAVFSSHNIEHLYPHEVPLALGEFLRVLHEDGMAVVTCPDLRSACALVAEDHLCDPAYVSPAGPVSPMDILYGHRPALASGQLHMAHRCGFTASVLAGTLRQAGFASVAVQPLPRRFELWAVACKAPTPESVLRNLAAQHFPSQ